MSFTIAVDYRFDTLGFFDVPERRAVLEEAAAIWENVIRDEFEDLPVGTSFTVRNPTTFASEAVTLAQTVDDLIIFVGARSFSGSTLAVAGPDGMDAAGDVYAARISSDFRNIGPVTDFEPWAGSISFDRDANWSFSQSAPSSNKSDFLSVAVHEIGHVLGFGTSSAFDLWMSNDNFTGPNARSVNDGLAIPLESDGGHVREGFADDTVSLDPILTNGARVLISTYDKAILADIGYDIVGFSKQGGTPAIATSAGERIFGRDVADTIDGLAGDDSIQGAGGNDRLSGGFGNDDLFGQSGNDTLLGGAGDDYLGGGMGNDVLQGGTGRDNYFGEGGTDTFVIRKGDGQNIISDFDVDTETIRLISSGFATASDALSAVTKAASNLSRLTFSDGTIVDVFHSTQSGTPLRLANFEVLDSESSTSVDMPDEKAEEPRLSTGENPPVGTVLTGTSANDTLIATAGLQRIDGLDGNDTAFFGGDQSDFVVTFSPDSVTVTDRSDGGLGTIALDNVELIDFGTDISAFGGPMNLSQFGGHTGLGEEAFESFVEMYIAYFNRAPDALGLAFWGTAYANGTSLEEIATEFAEQPETLATYPASTSNIRFAAEVYENVLGRSPDIDGLRFWTSALDNGAVSRGEFILEVLRGAKAAPAADAPQAFVDRQSADQQYLEQKTDLGALFAVHRGMSNVDDASLAIALFDGSAYSLQSAVEAIDTLYATAMDGVNGDFLMPLVGVLDNPFDV